ncbi:MAG: hypothetical protein VSS75_020225 [Candidatus Parabeggiatoa sp.]|nr:hypothetical protein [Candidatus Parabeggiatoa sp.]
MSKDLQATLDFASSKDNKIDGVFILLGKKGLITKTSQVGGFGGQPQIEQYRAWISRLAGIAETLGQSGYGPLHYSTFPMRDGIITLVFLNEGFNESIVVGFICEQPGNAEEALGEHLYNVSKFMWHGYTDKHGEKQQSINDLLKSIY